MTHSHTRRLPNKCSQNRILTLAVVSLVSACSSGSSTTSEKVETAHSRPGDSTADLANTEQNSSGQSTMPMNGTVVIEERNGKTVFDAFFSHNTASVLTYSSKDNLMALDECSVSVLQSDGSSARDVELGAANGAITIDSRVGQFETLIKQQEQAGFTVYAPDARWRSTSVPDDAVLSFDTDSGFDNLGSVKVPPLMPLVWLAPETGVMSNPAETLRWRATLDEQTQIKLQLSAIDFSNSKNPVVVSVSCDLVDDGLFNLPVEFQRQLPDDDTGIVVYAVRERVQEVQLDDMSLTVVQLGYPTLLQP